MCCRLLKCALARIWKHNPGVRFHPALSQESWPRKSAAHATESYNGPSSQSHPENRLLSNACFFMKNTPYPDGQPETTRKTLSCFKIWANSSYGLPPVSFTIHIRDFNSPLTWHFKAALLETGLSWSATYLWIRREFHFRCLVSSYGVNLLSTRYLGAILASLSLLTAHTTARKFIIILLKTYL